MARKTFTSDLSIDGINNLVKGIKEYQNSLRQKCEKFVGLLTECGIKVAKENIGNYGNYITFQVKTDPTADGCKAILIATNKNTIKREWKTKDGIKSADVSPLLMIEFGSGLKAKNPMDIPGVGTGTFPGGTHGNEPGWWYLDLNNVWHYSTGITPKQPMYKASLRMKEKIEQIAKTVFEEG